MKNYLFLLLSFSIILTSCIKDDLIEDFVEPTIRFTAFPDTIQENSTYQFEFMYLNNVGQEVNVEPTWSSSNSDIIEINSTGLATAVAAGKADITVEYIDGDNEINETITVNVGMTTVEASTDKEGIIKTTSSYALEGSFTLKEEGNQLILEFADDYKASTALPGLYIYLSNNRNTIANAFEIDAVETFNGSHSYTIDGLGINDFEFIVYFCKPFNVKVGDGEIQ